MKRYLLLIFSLLILVGCSYNEETLDTNEEKKENIIPDEPIYTDDNPLIVGLYQNGKLVKQIKNKLIKENDVMVFNIYFTNEEDTGSTNTKMNFNKYASNYNNINRYKIGFLVNYNVGDEEINKIITSPKDMYILSPYIFNYLYDDVHQADGSWYSHLEEKDINENTVYSSIKLYATDQINKITSPITLTVFTYDTADDFDNDGMYRGNSKYTITIEK